MPLACKTAVNLSDQIATGRTIPFARKIAVSRSDQMAVHNIELLTNRPILEDECSDRKCI